MEKEIFALVGFWEIILSIFMQWQAYTISNIKTFSVQSWILGIFLLWAGVFHGFIALIILALLTIITRAIAMPLYLGNTIRKQIYRARENKHRISTGLSILISLLLAVFGYLVYYLILAGHGQSLVSIPITLMLQGAFLIVSRSNAYSQLIGYLVMENSMFLLSFLFSELPFIVEVGIILDVLGVVVVAGLLMRVRDEDIEKEEELLG
jgi:Hydrogenase 4 membrane component (E)